MSLHEEISSIMRAPPRRFQTAGVRFLIRREGNALLMDSMGLGKTYQALAYMRMRMESSMPALVVCPASVKWQWLEELWDKARIRAGVATGMTSYRIPEDVWIVNYDILKAWHKEIAKFAPKLMILDEVQAAKNISAIRTRAAKAIGRNVQSVIGLSGTPIKSRPIEFFPILNLIAPEEFPSLYEYQYEFCNPQMGFRGQMDFRGASNLDKLRAKIEPYVLRRTKAEVLKELPPKIHTTIPVDIDNREYTQIENDFLSWVMKTKGLGSMKSAQRAMALTQLGELKRSAGRAKTRQVVDWVKRWLADNDGKIVVFGVQRDVVKQLIHAFPECAKVTADMKSQDRHAEITRFQADKGCRSFISSIRVGGVGLNLTEAATVLLAELEWTPADHDQAADRVHRFGQKARGVNIYYFVARGTVEEKIMAVLDRKRKVIGQILGDPESVMSMVVDEYLQKRGRAA